MGRRRPGSGSPVVCRDARGGPGLAAPFFTTRVGCSVVSHDRPARFPRGNWAESRLRFKDSYAPPRSPSRTREHRVTHKDPQRDPHEDPAENHRQQELKLQLAASQSEVHELRAALRAIAQSREDDGRVQQVLDKLDNVNQILQERLQVREEQVHERDEQITKLTCELDTAQRAGSNVRQTVLRAYGGWLDSSSMLWLREVWEVWHELQRQRHFRTIMKRNHGAMKPKIMKMVGGLASSSWQSEMRTLLSAWLSLACATRAEKEAAERRKQYVQSVVLLWNGTTENTARSVCWSAWREALEMGRKLRLQDQLRVEHHKEQEQMRRQSVLNTIEAMTSQHEAMEKDPMALRVFVIAWRQHALDCRARKALSMERDLRHASDARRQDSAKRAGLFFLSETNAQLHNCVELMCAFAPWRDIVVARRQTSQLKVHQLLLGVWSAWRATAAAGQRQRELEKELAERSKELKEHEQCALLARWSDKPEVLQLAAWNAWREAWTEARHERDRETWQLEWEAKRQQDLNQERRRVVGLMMSQDQPVLQSVLMHAMWSAWCDAIVDIRRDKALDVAQRRFEDMQRKAEQDAVQLSAERAALDEKHHEAHSRRKVVFLLSLALRDTKILLQTMWQSWREVVKERYVEQIWELRDKLHEMKLAHGGEDVQKKRGCCGWLSRCCLHPCTSLHRCCLRSSATKVSPGSDWEQASIQLGLASILSSKRAQASLPADGVVSAAGKNPRVFFDMTIGSSTGRIVMELRADLVPNTAENFRCLCTGERGKSKAGHKLSFRGSSMHHVVPGNLCQGGDITANDGTGGVSIYGPTFADESFELLHTGPGILSMANKGPDTNSSQFYLSFAPLPDRDGKHVVFGKVTEGMDVLRKIEAVGSAEGSLSKPVVVADCGELSL